MFDGPITEGIDLDGAMVVLDLSAMRDSEALAMLMTCSAAWQQAILRERKEAADRAGVAMRKTFCVFEEVWRVASNLGVAEWLQANFKLCRAPGIANLVPLHKLTDFGTAGSEGSRWRRSLGPGRRRKPLRTSGASTGDLRFERPRSIDSGPGSIEPVSGGNPFAR